MGGDDLRLGRSGVALAMCQTLVVLHLQAGLGEGDEHSPMLGEGDEHSPMLSCGAWLTVLTLLTSSHRHRYFWILSNWPIFRLQVL